MHRDDLHGERERKAEYHVHVTAGVVVAERPLAWQRVGLLSPREQRVVPNAQLGCRHASGGIFADEVEHCLPEPDHGIGALRLGGFESAGDLQAFPRGDGELYGNQRGEQGRQDTCIWRSERECAQRITEPDNGHDREQREPSRPNHEKIEPKRYSHHEIKRQGDALDVARYARRGDDAVGVENEIQQAKTDQAQSLPSCCIHLFSLLASLGQIISVALNW